MSTECDASGSDLSSGRSGAGVPTADSPAEPGRWLSWTWVCGMGDHFPLLAPGVTDPLDNEGGCDGEVVGEWANSGTAAVRDSEGRVWQLTSSRYERER